MFSIKARLISQPIKRVSVQQVVARATSEFLRRQGGVYLRLMEQEAPVGATGQLSRSHVLRLLNQYRAEITNTQRYAAAVQEGSRPHMPPESSGLPYPVRMHIAQHGTRPNPWMTRAAQMGSQEIQGNADRLAADIVKELF